MKNKAIIILGMHRSGTSALSRICNLIGAEIGNNLVPVAADNPKGFWEHNEIVEIHKRLLSDIGSSYEDVRILPSNLLELTKNHQQQIKKVLLDDFRSSNIWLMKDPRICRLMPIWLLVIKELEIEPLFVLAIRNPVEVALSLEKRNYFSFSKSLILWMLHNLEAEYYSRNFNRLIVEYNNIIKKPLEIAEKISAFDGRLSPDKEAISQFVDLSLRHQNISDDDPRMSLIHQMGEVYMMLKNPNIDCNFLDNVYQQLKHDLQKFSVLIEYEDQKMKYLHYMAKR